jgi:hypothetical protein
VILDKCRGVRLGKSEEFKKQEAPWFAPCLWSGWKTILCVRIVVKTKKTTRLSVSTILGQGLAPVAKKRRRNPRARVYPIAMRAYQKATHRMETTLNSLDPQTSSSWFTWIIRTAARRAVLPTAPASKLQRYVAEK